MKRITIELKPNLFLSDDRVISYSTEVARIKDNRIVMLGKYTRTTTKQVQWLANFFGHEITWNQKPGLFYQLPMGFGRTSLSGALRSSISKRIVDYIKQGYDLTTATVVNYDRLSAEEQRVVLPVLKRQGYSEKSIYDSIEAQRFLEKIELV
jgi:hypothetical protein